MADNTFVNVGGHKVSVGKKYSTSEVKTGDVWIDGKPIYRLTVTGTPEKTAGSYRDVYLVTATITNISTYICGIGHYRALRSGAYRQSVIPTASFSNDSAKTPTVFGDIVLSEPNTMTGEVLTVSGFFTSVDNITYTVWYTKTTD